MITLTQHLNDLIPASILETFNRFLGVAERLLTQIEERRLQGIYDVQSQIRTVTIHDRKGHKATVETVQRLRFRQNHVTALTEYAWGQGDLFADYRCSPGVPVDYYDEGSRRVVLISLRGKKNAGDTMTLRSHRLVMEGFSRNKEYWESDVYHRTQKLELRIIFPLKRSCQRATLTMRNTGQTVALGAECYQSLPDGRKKLVWVCDKPQVNERYLLSWTW